MTGRARADQVARRVNAAADLLGAGLAIPDIAQRLSRQHEISERQARRYVDQARKRGRVSVPPPKSVFTVKLPTDLIERLRESSRAQRETLSSLVTQALEEFLRPRRAGPRSGR